MQILDKLLNKVDQTFEVNQMVYIAAQNEIMHVVNNQKRIDETERINGLSEKPCIGSLDDRARWTVADHDSRDDRNLNGSQHGCGLNLPTETQSFKEAIKKIIDKDLGSDLTNMGLKLSDFSVLENSRSNDLINSFNTLNNARILIIIIIQMVSISSDSDLKTTNGKDFTVIDLTAGRHQTQFNPGGVKQSAIRYDLKLFEYLVMQMDIP